MGSVDFKQWSDCLSLKQYEIYAGCVHFHCGYFTQIQDTHLWRQYCCFCQKTLNLRECANLYTYEKCNDAVFWGLAFRLDGM